MQILHEHSAWVHRLDNTVIIAQLPVLIITILICTHKSGLLGEMKQIISASESLNIIIAHSRLEE